VVEGDRRRELVERHGEPALPVHPIGEHALQVGWRGIDADRLSGRIFDTRAPPAGKGLGSHRPGGPDGVGPLDKVGVRLDLSRLQRPTTRPLPHLRGSAAPPMPLSALLEFLWCQLRRLVTTPYDPEPLFDGFLARAQVQEGA
jgi:hypothetical protein